MSPYCYCRDCAHADVRRIHGDNIRCQRWSVWVSPVRLPCEEFRPKKAQEKEATL